MADREYFGFVWDENKNEKNKANHKISFETATRIFLDPYLYFELDKRHSTQDEIRYKNVGAVEGNSIIAVWTTDRNGKIRIISARKAQKCERRIYDRNAKNLQAH